MSTLLMFNIWQEFLAEAQKISEMHIYTHGNAEYAAEMARLLDPTKQYFAERIISQAHARVLSPPITRAILRYCWGGSQLPACSCMACMCWL